MAHSHLEQHLLVLLVRLGLDLRVELVHGLKLRVGLAAFFCGALRDVRITSVSKEGGGEAGATRKSEVDHGRQVGGSGQRAAEAEEQGCCCGWLPA